MYHYHGIDAEESILTKSLPNLGTWALPNLFFIISSVIEFTELILQEILKTRLNTKLKQRRWDPPLVTCFGAIPRV